MIFLFILLIFNGRWQTDIYSIIHFRNKYISNITLSTDKNKYGIRLRAEPDHMVLGKRLKGAFKMVMTSIKQLSNEELERFQENGGHLFHWGAPFVSST